MVEKLLAGLSGLPKKHLLPTRNELGWSLASRCKRGIRSKPKGPELLGVIQIFATVLERFSFEEISVLTLQKNELHLKLLLLEIVEK